MYRIAVIGGHGTVLGFKALGLDTFPANNAEEGRAILRQLTADGADYAIIYIEENVAAGMLSEINAFKDRPIPAIILIPGRDGPLGLGLTALNDAVEKAVGVNILEQ